MKIKHFAKKSLSIVLALSIVLTMLLPTGVAFASSKAWVGAPEGDIIIKDVVRGITNGVYENEVTFNTESGNDQKIDYMCTVEKSAYESGDIKIVASYGDDDASSWKMTSVTHQAECYEKHHPSETVVAAINADFFNMATGEPLGALVMDGTVYSPSKNKWYFGITKTGEPVIRNSTDLSDLQTAVGGYTPLIVNGEIVEESLPEGEYDYSRCTIGIMKDGSVVSSVTHGRLVPVSCGRTYKEIAQMYKEAGAEYVLNLDGGGSATYASRLEGTDKLVVRNSPSDGAPREVSSSLLIVSTKEPTGVFDHSTVTPNNEIYTPGSTVQFTANAVDTASASMEFPEADYSWELAEDSKELGTIDEETGVFTAGEQTGVVNVNHLMNGNVVGSTSIEIVVPDTIYFSSEEASLGFEDETDLGLVVRSNGRDINIKAGDIVWTNTVYDSEAKEYFDDENHILGTFDGNIFKSNDSVSTNGYVTATSAYGDVSGSIKVIVGMLPTIVWDFEDVVDEETNEVIPASDYYVGEDGILSHSNYNRGGKESLEIANLSDEEPVRFGAHSLKLSYDFSDCGAVTEGACLGTSAGMEIPGMPTGIGVWVYAPYGVGVDWPNDDGISGLWFRGYVFDATGNNMPYNFTLEPKSLGEGEKPGIYWEGWQYCEADLTTLQGPFKIAPGMTFRLMFVAGTKMVGTQRTGEIYLDNFQFVYGTNVDDTDNPIIDTITANDVEINNGDVITTNTISFASRFHDVENKYTTGIDASTIRMYIDGVNVIDNDRFTYDTGDSKYVLDPDGTQNHLYDVKLKDGDHSVTVTIRDGFGNETSETREFTVKGNSEATASKINIVPETSTAFIGNKMILNIVATGKNISDCTIQFKLGNKFKSFNTEFADDVNGTSKYSKLSDLITITAQPSEAKSFGNGEVIARLVVDVPVTLKNTDEFTYAIKGGSYTRTNGTFDTFALRTKSIPVDAEYKIENDRIYEGDISNDIYVLNYEGQPAQNVTLYLADDDSVIGKTDENGVITTDYFSKSASNKVVYAMDDNGVLSFRKTISSYNPVGIINVPFGVKFNANDSAENTKSISWFSCIRTGEQFLRYRAEGSEEWIEVKATQSEKIFTKDGNSASMVNNVRITDLQPGTYEYEIGSGENWTETATFKIKEKKDTTSFFVIGDMQSEQDENILTIVQALQNGDYDFGIQTGDAVDDAVKFSDWFRVTHQLGAYSLADTDMIQVLGNHEYAGDANADIASTVYDLPTAKAGSYYSVTYGDVYVAVINYTGTEEQLKEALEWLKSDAKKSNATWKILSMHQPAYYTNAIGGNAEINRFVPDAVEEAGIDCVFSGHDHALARTNPLKDDEINEDEGVVYYICGSTGEKSYSVTTQSIFDYDKVFSLVTGNGYGTGYNATVLSATANKDEMTVNIYDTKMGLIDSYTFRSTCNKNGHSYKYDAESKLVKCSVCETEEKEYTGIIDDAQGNTYYLVNGVAQTGWAVYGDDVYFLDENGVSQEIEVIEDVPTTCTTRGYRLYASDKADESFKVKYVKANGHAYNENRVCEKCGWKEISLNDCDITLSGTTFNYTGKKRYPIVKVTYTDKDGNTIEFEKGVDYKLRYANNLEIGKASVTVVPITKFTGDAVNHKGNFKAGETVVKEYKIVPVLNNLKVKATTSSATLSWDESANADGYKVYMYDKAKGKFVLKKTIKSASTTSYTVNNLKKAYHHSFKVKAYKVIDGEAYESFQKKVCVNTKPAKVTGVKLTAKDNAFTVKWSKTTCTEYQIRYSTSSDFTSYKTITVKGKDASKTIKKLKNKKTYYVKVRAVKKYNTSHCPTAYGAWSKTCSVKTK